MTEPGRRLRSVAVLAVVSALANLGTRVSAIAIPWFVLTTTNSATATALVTAFELAPYVAVKALAGPIVDRIGQRRISIWADIGSALTIGLIPVLQLTGGLRFWLLLMLVAIAGALRGPGDSAKHTMVPLVAAYSRIPLERATGLFGAIERSSGLVGPGLAALTIGVFGPPGAIAVNAACFAVSAVIVLAVLPRVVDRQPERDSAAEPAGPAGQRGRFRGYFTALIEGFRFLAADRVLLTLTIMVAVTNLFDMAKSAVLLPVWAKTTGHGVSAISLLLTCFAVFSVVSSLLASWLGPRLPRRTVYFIGFLLAGPPPFVVLGLDLPVWAVAVVYCLSGFGAGFLNPILGAVFFERIPQQLLGRVGGLSDAAAWLGTPFGGLVGAALIALVGLNPTFLIFAGGYLLATVIPGVAFPALFARGVRAADRLPA